MFARLVDGRSASLILNRPSPPNSEPRTDNGPAYVESTMRDATCPSEYQLNCPARYTGPDPNPDVLDEEAGQLAVKAAGRFTPAWPVLKEEHPPISNAATVPAIARRVIRRIP